MTPIAPMTTELADLLESHCLGELSPAGARRLDELVRTDEDCCRHYILFMQMHALAERFDGGDAQREARRLEALVPPEVVPTHSSSFILHPSSIPHIVVDSAPTRHSPVGSFVFSHIAAAVILGIGLLIGLAWRISLPSPERQEQSGTGYASEAVGRITALADCQWHKEGSEGSGQDSGISNLQISKSPNLQIPIFLSDRFMLSSGLMEITYDTGAKVILQGPCTYEIDSERGGYLAVGKLTAKVEKKSGATPPSAFSLQPSALFAVRTPTATVTDLGTEFGVEVERSGATRSHVFQGSVEVRSSNSRRLTTSGAVEILRAGQSARVERGRNQKAIITREPGQPSRFVRRISKSPNGQISNSSNPQSLIPNPFFRLTDLGTLGGKTSQAVVINTVGQVVGSTEDAHGVLRAFLYFKGEMRDLGVFRNNASSAVDINNSGQVVGACGSSTNSFAFLYSNGTTTNLGTLGGSSAFAYAINDSGHIVGASLNSNGVRRAFLYTADKGMQDIGALGGPAANSCAMSINATGQVTGYSESRRGRVRGFLYTPDTGMKDLGVLKGYDDSLAFSLNDTGHIAGVSLAANGQRRIFMCNDRMEMKGLSNLNGMAYFALVINNIGQIIVNAEKETNSLDNAHSVHSYLYNAGSMHRLADLLDDSAAGWTNLRTNDINGSSHIVGEGIAPDGNIHAFMLTPIVHR